MKKHQTLYAIGIPTINRADLLQPTLERYCQDFPNTAIYIVDNGFQDFDRSKFNNNVHFIVNDQNNGVAGSWNQLLEKIYNGIPGVSQGCDHALILNDDIYLGKTERQIQEFIVVNLFHLAVQPGTWCSFILPKIIFNKVGPFDSRFYPAYFEDNDYDYRVRLAGFIPTPHPELAPEVYRNSMTIEKNQALNARFEDNKRLYVSKWGGEPLRETYLLPFNGLHE